MAKKKVKRGFSKLSQEELKTTSNTVSTDIAAKPAVYTDPDPTTAVMNANRSDYITKINAYNLAKDIVKQKKLDRDNARNVVVTDLDTQANYIDKIANGDETKITDAGFEATDIIKSTRPIPGDILNFKISFGHQECEIDFTCKKNDLVDEYVIQISKTPDDPKSWVIKKTFSKRKGTLTDLSSGDKLSIRCAGKNTSGTGPYCMHLTILVP